MKHFRGDQAQEQDCIVKTGALEDEICAGDDIKLYPADDVPLVEEPRKIMSLRKKRIEAHDFGGMQTDNASNMTCVTTNHSGPAIGGMAKIAIENNYTPQTVAEIPENFFSDPDLEVLPFEKRRPSLVPGSKSENPNSDKALGGLAGTAFSPISFSQDMDLIEEFNPVPAVDTNDFITDDFDAILPSALVSSRKAPDHTTASRLHENGCMKPKSAPAPPLSSHNSFSTPAVPSKFTESNLVDQSNSNSKPPSFMTIEEQKVQTPLRQEVHPLAPFSSKADLLAEKARISMEICDLMDLIDNAVNKNDADGHRLSELKRRRRNIDTLLSSPSTVALDSLEINSKESPLSRADVINGQRASTGGALLEDSLWAGMDFPWSRNVKKAIKQ